MGYKSSSSPSSSKVSPLRSHIAKLSNPFTRLLGRESKDITSEVYDNNIIPISTIAAAATPAVASQQKSSTRTAKVSPHKGGGGGGGDSKRPAQKQLTHPLTTSVIKAMTSKIKAAMSPTMKASSKKTDQKLTTKLLPKSNVSTIIATTAIATKAHNLFDYMFRDSALSTKIVDEKQVHHLHTQSSLEDNEQILSSSIINDIQTTNNMLEQTLLPSKMILKNSNAFNKNVNVNDTSSPLHKQMSTVDTVESPLSPSDAMHSSEVGHDHG
jgi:hypothetical protein